MTASVSATEALQRLKAGNSRFVDGAGNVTRSHMPPAQTASGHQQKPIAIVLGCSDARVPAEMVFDQGFGDLFVIRVAGNVVAPSQVGSVEFAAMQFGVRLVVVLGHTQCGAVMATLDELRRADATRTAGLRAIVDRVRPGVEPLLENFDLDSPALLTAAVRANIHASVRQLQEGSALISDLVAEQGMRIVGAEYSLETGVVEFLDDTA